MKLKLGRTGFTIIEVVLVLAITGILFVGLLAVQGNNLARRRYNDAVTSFRDFLQNQYDFGTNIQNWRESAASAQGGGTICTGTLSVPDNELGRSNCAIYGVMLEFGSGDCSDTRRTGRCYTRFSWVVGNDYDRNTLFENADGGNLGDSLGEGSLNDYNVLLGSELRRIAPGREYHLEWGAGLRMASVNGGAAPDMTGAMLVIRMPVSNTIKTFIYDKDLSTLGMVSSFDDMGYPAVGGENARVNNQDVAGGVAGIKRIIEEARDALGQIESTDNMNDTRRFEFICIESSDSILLGGISSKRIVAIAQGGSNASAVRLLDQDRTGDQYEMEGGSYNVKCN